jgi:hypothetical protein
MLLKKPYKILNRGTTMGQPTKIGISTDKLENHVALAERLAGCYTTGGEP